MTAYTVAANMFGKTGVPLKAKKIIRTMKMANRIMSEKVVQFWIDKFKPYLFTSCSNKDFGEMSARGENEPFIYPHEFLILCSQAKNNIIVLHSAIEDIIENKLSFKQTENGIMKSTGMKAGTKLIKELVKETLNNEMNVNKIQITRNDEIKMENKKNKKLTTFPLLDNWQMELINQTEKRNIRPFRISDGEVSTVSRNSATSLYKEIKKRQSEQDYGVKMVIGEHLFNKTTEITTKVNKLQSLLKFADNEKSNFYGLFATTGTTPFSNNTEKRQIISKRPQTHVRSRTCTTEFKKRNVNFIHKNMQLVHYHPINEERIKLAEEFYKTQRAKSAKRTPMRSNSKENNLKSGSGWFRSTVDTRCSTRESVLTKMGNLFETEYGLTIDSRIKSEKKTASRAKERKHLL